MLEGTQNIKKYFLIIGILVILFGFFVALDNFTIPTSSVEVGFTSTSPLGVAGGIAVPASCSSDPHDATDCVAPVGELFTTPSISQQDDPYVVVWRENSFPDPTDCTLDKSEDGGLTWTLVGIATNCDETTAQSSATIGIIEYRLTMTNVYGGPTVELHSHSIVLKNPDLSVSPATINEGDSVTIDWTCYASAINSALNAGVKFSADTDGDGLGNSSGVVISSPTITTLYELYCENGGYRSGSVTVRAPAVAITAVPTLVSPGDTSTVSWSADGMNDCTVIGTDGYSDSWDIISGPPLPYVGSNTTGPVNERIKYTITCTTSAQIWEDFIVININPVFEEF